MNVEVVVTQSSRPSISQEKIYHDDYSVPFLVRNYEAGDVFTVSVTYSWNG